MGIGFVSAHGSVVHIEGGHFVGSSDDRLSTSERAAIRAAVRAAKAAAKAKRDNSK